MQIYSVGIVVHLGIQSTAAALVPAARSADGIDAAIAKVPQPQSQRLHKP